jgi:hypothetical protein
MPPPKAERSYTGSLDQQGKYHGYGKYEINVGTKDFESYCGNFVHGRREGRGIQKRADGFEYEGEWKEDLKNGFGVATWTNGKKYSGEWKVWL